MTDPTAPVHLVERTTPAYAPDDGPISVPTLDALRELAGHADYEPQRSLFAGL